MKIAALQIGIVDVGDLEFAAPGWLNPGRDFHHVGVVKVKSSDGKMAARLLRLFNDRNNASLRIDLCNAVSFRIVDRMHEDGRTLVAGRRFAQMLRQAMAEEHVVAEHKRRTLTVDEIGADDKGLGK